MNVSCKETLALLSTGESHASLEDVELHLQHCSECQRAFDVNLGSDLEIEQRLSMLNKRVEVPDSLHELINTTIQVVPAEEAASKSKLQAKTWLIAVMAIAAAVLFVVAVAAWQKATHQNGDLIATSTSGQLAEEVVSSGLQTSESDSRNPVQLPEITLENEAVDGFRPVVRGSNGYSVVSLDSAEDEIPFLLMVPPAR